jgi:uncharacterized protein
MLFLSRLLTLGAIAVFLTTADLSAQAIKCNAAVTADEVTICGAKKLKKLDRQLGKIYDAVLGEAHKDLHYMIREEQAAFVRSRNRCRSGRRCIRRHYNARINELSAMLDDGDVPDQPEVAEGCTVYRHANFNGDQVVVNPNSQMSFFGTNFDNQASSVRLGGSCYLQGYTRAFYNGRDERYQQDTPNFGDMNDRISSVRCICR